MRLAPVIAALAYLAAACSGSPGDPKPAQPPSQSPADRADAGAAAGAPKRDAAPRPLTRADCAELVGHIVDLAVREDAVENPGLPPPDDEELAAMRRALAGELEDRCVGKERGVYDCAMAAQTRDDLEACERD